VRAGQPLAEFERIETDSPALSVAPP
jgi:hypothetical protein